MGAPVNLLNRVTISPHMRVAPLPQDHLALLDARADMIRTRRMLYHKETALLGAVTARIIASVPGYRGPTGGTGVTPGHVFLCGAGRFAGRHVPLIDILRDDGAVGRLGGIRPAAAKCCLVGSGPRGTRLTRSRTRSLIPNAARKLIARPLHVLCFRSWVGGKTLRPIQSAPIDGSTLLASSAVGATRL